MSKQESIKDAIKSYLDERARTDELFARSYAKKNKSIDECFAYIMGEALKNSIAIASGAKGCAMDNDVVYGMAVHYYDEDDIKVTTMPTNIRTSATTTTPPKPDKLTEEVEKKAREEAIKRLTEEQYAMLKKKPSRSKKEATEVKQMSLF